MCSQQTYTNVDIFTSGDGINFHYSATVSSCSIRRFDSATFAKWDMGPHSRDAASMIYDKMGCFQKLFAKNARGPFNNNPMGHQPLNPIYRYSLSRRCIGDWSWK